MIYHVTNFIRCEFVDSLMVENVEISSYCIYPVE